MLTNLLTYFYPGISKDEVKKFGLLSVIFFLIIGAYWSIRLLKNTIFMSTAFPAALGWAKDYGAEWQPKAKWISLAVVFIMVIVYSKLIDKYKKHQVFYIICGVYATLFMLICSVIFIYHTNGGQSIIAEDQVRGAQALGKFFAYIPELITKMFGGTFTANYQYIGKIMLAVTGWSSFFIAESFGSLVVSLFWSFTSSIVTSESAKHGYPLIVTVAQIAAILGSIPLFFAKNIGIWPVLFITSILVYLVIPAVSYFVKVMPADQLVGNKLAAQTEKKKEGFFASLWSGIVVLFTRPYLIGIFIMSTFYEAMAQIVEYQMQRQALLNPTFHGTFGYGQFQSIYGMSVNVLSFLIAFLGTGQIIKRLGVKTALLIYPVSFFAALAVVGFAYFTGLAGGSSALLWTLFAVMVFVKGIGYAVSNPTKEMMYIPTSKDVKFKVKGFIDTFGSRLAKAGGTVVTDAFRGNLQALMLNGTMISLVLNVIWMFAAIYVGNQNAKLTKENKIIE